MFFSKYFTIKTERYILFCALKETSVPRCKDSLLFLKTQYSNHLITGLVWYSNGRFVCVQLSNGPVFKWWLKTRLKKACFRSIMSGIWMVRKVMWLTHLNTGHTYCPVFRWLLYVPVSPCLFLGNFACSFCGALFSFSSLPVELESLFPVWEKLPLRRAPAKKKKDLKISTWRIQPWWLSGIMNSKFK